MKRREVYKLPSKLKGTDEERIIGREVNEFLIRNYLELEPINSMQYLHEEQGSLMVIRYGEDICHDKIVDIQISSKEIKVPKELSDLLTSKGFIKIQK
ncbi:MAG: hypothetical protein PHH54_04310 [Candidatus Nanoarchaeia archaeon]|nr:hypothetical protein [Candidatus Nanoarchaeia archaeon]MDD5741184.1 hypothetical protein [Candidatus Nanoarchaeia archaeon]